jgi:hypothetical protein
VKNSITQELIKARLAYDSNAGSFYWLERNPSSHPKPHIIKAWNTKYAGTRADNLNLRGYYDVCLDGKAYRSHRLAWLYTYGELPDGQIDHINGVRTDNRVDNLRVVDDATNRKNMGRRSDNTSGVTGVTFHKAARKWVAQYRINGKNYYLGLFDTVLEAAKARKEASKNAGFHENHGSIRLIKNQDFSSEVSHV